MRVAAFHVKLSARCVYCEVAQGSPPRGFVVSLRRLPAAFHVKRKYRY